MRPHWLLLFVGAVSRMAGQQVPQLSVEPPVAPPAVVSSPQPSPQPQQTPGGAWFGGMSPAVSSETDMRILEVPLIEGRILRLPTNPTVTTTISFPQPIDGMDGAGFVIDPEKEGGDFLLSYTPGAHYVSITPRSEGARRNLNVVVGGKVIVIEPYPVPSYLLAVTSVKVTNRVANLVKVPSGSYPSVTASRQSGGGGLIPGIDEPLDAKRLSTPPKPAFEPAGAAKLLGVLDTIKALSALEGGKLEAALAVMPHVQLAERGRDSDRAEFGDYTVVLRRVLRNNKIDCLAFEAEVVNTSSRDLLFDPETFQVRVGSEVYPQVVTDFNPMLAAGRSTTAYFAIITSPSGKPNYLAVDNDFHVSVKGGVAGSEPRAVKTEKSKKAQSGPGTADFKGNIQTPKVTQKQEVKPMPVVSKVKAETPETPSSVAQKPTPAADKPPTLSQPNAQPKVVVIDDTKKSPSKTVKPQDDDVIVIRSKDGSTQTMEVQPSKAK